MYNCPICLSNHLEDFFCLKNSPPLQNILFQAESDAKAVKRFDVNFVYCPACHFVFNPRFCENETVYSEKYDNNQLGSKTYLQYIDRLVDMIIQYSELSSNSRILEIGCGNGYFLYQLHKRLNNKNVQGYDPAYNGQYGMHKYIKKTYFDAKNSEAFDLIIFRHCLESLVDYSKVLNSLASVIHEDTRIYAEVIDLEGIIEKKDIFSFYHEYSRYYSLTALSRLFGKFKLIIRKSVSLFDGQYLGVFATRNPSMKNLEKKLDKLKKITAKHKKIVIWGISGRAVSILAHLNWDQNKIKFGVDIDKNKQGKYIPVTGQRVISPEEAAAFKPDLVIVANSNYLHEIKEGFSFETEFITIDS